MAKDNRYIAVKSLIETGRIERFPTIFIHIPKKVVYTDLGLNYSKFIRLINSPDLFTIRELDNLAKLIEIDVRVMFKIAFFPSEVERNIQRDNRYLAIKSLVETKRINNFREIFEHIPYMVVYTDLGMHYARLIRLIASPDLFTLHELAILAYMVEIDPIVIFEMAYSQHVLDKTKKIKRRK